jgi:3-hydroxyisobutyrate dehydrogenase-like beta-hydroxyacid dehydrogenase
MFGIPLSVACIGLGRIGAGIARNIQVSGCSLTVYNRDPKKTESFSASGRHELDRRAKLPQRRIS